MVDKPAGRNGTFFRSHSCAGCNIENRAHYEQIFAPYDAFGGQPWVTKWGRGRRVGVFPKSLGFGSCLGVVAGWLWGSSDTALSGISTLSASPLSSMSRGGNVSPPGSLECPSQQPLSDVAGATADAGMHQTESVIDNTLAGVAVRTRSETEPSRECPEGMKPVVGDYCTVVVQHCIAPFADGSGRCHRFAPGATCQGTILSLKFCIDEFEYPNQRQEKPEVMVTFAEATRLCVSRGKRLCSGREWTLACEGPDRLPYPTGNERDATACNVDLVHRFPDVDALNHPATAARELARLDQRTPSGSLSHCISPFGVYDMMGNVDEWVIPDGNEEAAGYGAKTALKGGYFGPVRARCRPSTPSHAPTFKFYQVGFRCCRDLDAELVQSPDP